MVKLEAGNCPIKPSQRRQLTSWLKRAVHLGQQVGRFLLTITIRRVNRGWELVASVHDAAGSFVCRSRGQTWRDACRSMVRTVSSKLHAQRLAMANI